MRGWNLAAELDDLRQQDLWRELKPLDEVRGVLVQRDGHERVNFSSNDYLGLAHSEAMRAALEDGVTRYGGGSGASRLVCGTHRIHAELEEALADFKGSEAALAFSSGFAVALGVIPALVGPGDTVILDKLCHACLVDAARLSGATIRVFPHNHLEKLERLLRTAQGRALVVTESIFSMDGDAAPLAQIVELKEKHGAWLLVDEAHAVGILGPQGRGLAAELDVGGRIDLHMGTLSKALGLSGGYLAASRQVIDLLVNRARSFIYTTAPPPHLAHAALEILQLTRSERGDALRQILRGHVDCLLAALKCPKVQGAILPLILGSEAAALAASQQLCEAGFLVPCIRYPTVARSSARLRFTLSAAHTSTQVTVLCQALSCLEAQGMP